MVVVELQDIANKIRELEKEIAELTISFNALESEEDRMKIGMQIGEKNAEKDKQLKLLQETIKKYV
jgi:hypothetical protein